MNQLLKEDGPNPGKFEGPRKMSMNGMEGRVSYRETQKTHRSHVGEFNLKKENPHTNAHFILCVLKMLGLLGRTDMAHMDATSLLVSKVAIDMFP